MKKVKMIYALTALALVASGGAYAEQIKKSTTTVTTESETTRVTRPLAVTGDTKEVKPAIERFVERINMARLDLAAGKAKEAVFNLDEAERHMRFIKKNSNYKEISKQTVVSAGEIVYDSEQITYSSYYVPLTEGPVVVKDYVSGQNESGRSSDNVLAVKSAKAVYLNVDLTGDTAENAIDKARHDITEGQLTAANETLAEMLDQITSTSSVQSKPEVVARDNLDLALSSLENENYVAARFALAHTLEALESMKRDDGYSIKQVDDVTDRVSQIKDLLMQETTNAAQKARTQIKATQADLEDLS